MRGKSACSRRRRRVQHLQMGPASSALIPFRTFVAAFPRHICGGPRFSQKKIARIRPKIRSRRPSPPFSRVWRLPSKRSALRAWWTSSSRSLQHNWKRSVLFSIFCRSPLARRSWLCSATHRRPPSSSLPSCRPSVKAFCESTCQACRCLKRAVPSTSRARWNSTCRPLARSRRRACSCCSLQPPTFRRCAWAAVWLQTLLRLACCSNCFRASPQPKFVTTGSHILLQSRSVLACLFCTGQSWTQGRLQRSQRAALGCALTRAGSASIRPPQNVLLV